MPELGVDILDCDSMVDMKRARQLLGPRVVLTGNLDPVKAIMNGTPQSIREGFRRVYEEVGNPYFVNAGCEVPGTTPHDNLRAMCEPIEWKG
jgi:uroporphyrinogen decarboxylase